MDIRNYISPGFSYRSFLLAYGCTAEKFFFPYHFIRDLKALEHPSVPPYEAFFSEITNSNISLSEYEFVKKIWKEKEWKTLKDMLIYYNVMDCGPFVEAVGKMLQPYLAQGIDIFKSSFSVSGVAKIQMLQRCEKEAFFCLFPKRHADLYHTLRSNITGGLSIVFTRLAIKDETKIRPHEVSNPETCKKVIGLDANSLYLHAISQDLPCSYFIRYREKDHYRPDPCCKYGLSSYQWLKWISHTQNKEIQHKYSGQGEKKLTQHSLIVDGFAPATNEVFEFDGCFWHGCDKCSANPDGSPKKVHPVNGKTYEQLRQDTLNKTKKLEEAGYRVNRIRECEWKKLKRNPEVASFLKKLKCVEPRKQLTFEKIIEGIQSESLFGLLICSIHTPEELKPKFSDFPPIIKNTMISRSDIGEYMQKIAEEQGFLKKPRKYLISSYFGEEILINTRMAKFYLELGLKITRIQEFIQFFPMKCFDELSQEIVQNRRLGDIDPDKKVLAMTSKLCGNSLYSATLLNRSKHRAVTYHTDSNINEAINNPWFSHLEQLKPGLYEVKSLKKQIKHDLPLQLGISVYLEAKLHILKFFYHFLDKYIPKKCYSLIESDTDSLYFSISRDSLDDCVPQHLKEEYFREKRKYMPAECCDECLSKFIDVKVSGGIWTSPSCCQKRNAFDTRVLGLMKTEYEGEKAVALTCKTYFCEGKSKKQVCKGVSIRQNPLTFERYFQAHERIQL